MIAETGQTLVVILIVAVAGLFLILSVRKAIKGGGGCCSTRSACCPGRENDDQPDHPTPFVPSDDLADRARRLADEKKTPPS